MNRNSAHILIYGCILFFVKVNDSWNVHVRTSVFFSKIQTQKIGKLIGLNAFLFVKRTSNIILKIMRNGWKKNTQKIFLAVWKYAIFGGNPRWTQKNPRRRRKKYPKSNTCMLDNPLARLNNNLLRIWPRALVTTNADSCPAWRYACLANS